MSTDDSYEMRILWKWIGRPNSIVTVSTVQEISEGESYTAITGDFRVTVQPAFVDERSDISACIYVFLYKVTIENRGQIGASLINRHWKVFSGTSQIADVKGEGVVGEQPVIEPGNSFQYTSWTVIKDPVGSMIGTYTLRAASGSFFDVEVPRFDLIYIDSAAIH